MDTMGDLWSHGTQSQESLAVDANVIAGNDPLIFFGSSGENGIHYEPSTIGAFHTSFPLPDLNMGSSADFGLDGTIMFGNGLMCSGFMSPRLLPPSIAGMPTERKQLQLKANKTRRQTKKGQTKRTSVLEKEEENSFIQSLRTQNVPWKDISQLFHQRFNKVMSNASLQMRMLRRRKKAGPWTDSDIELLHEAYNYWEKRKYALIATKLQELGTSRTYTEQQVTLQLEQLSVLMDQSPIPDKHTFVISLYRGSHVVIQTAAVNFSIQRHEG